jgi:hypothetical protein
MSDNIIKLAHVNNDVGTKGAAASELVVSFLREWADAIESGDEDAHKAVLIMYADREPGGPGNEAFVVRVRRCNLGLVEQVGLMTMAQADLIAYEG